jgi:hypothetical protein
MIRKVIRAAAVLLTALVIPAAVLAAPLPAGAASGSMCERYGSYCLYVTSFSNYTPVDENISFSNTLNSVLQSGSTYLIEFNGNNDKCVASDNAGTKVEIKPCDASFGTLWTLKTSNGLDMWINQAASRLVGVDLYLTGDECSPSCQYQLKVEGYNGGRQKFYFT